MILKKNVCTLILGAIFAKIKAYTVILRRVSHICPDFHRFFPDFKEFCPDFHQIKSFGSALAPPAPPPPTPVD